MGEIFERYTLGETLGSGGFAEVVIGVQKATAKKFAIKIIDKVPPYISPSLLFFLPESTHVMLQFMFCQAVTQEADAQALETELNILRSVNHPNIIHYEEHFDTPSKLYIVLELCVITISLPACLPASLAIPLIAHAGWKEVSFSIRSRGSKGRPPTRRTTLAASFGRSSRPSSSFTLVT
jgi:hypothetical protein